MDTFNSIIGGIMCPVIAFLVQATFVYWAAKFVRASCTFKEAAIMAGICAVLLFVPKVGFILSPIAFFVLFKRMLAADGIQTLYAFLAFIVLNTVLIAVTG
jgi:hypothetical protein